jgi:hypothetical protein
MNSLYEKDVVSEKKGTVIGNFVIEQIIYERKEFSLLRSVFFTNREKKTCDILHMARRALIEQTVSTGNCGYSSLTEGCIISPMYNTVSDIRSSYHKGEQQLKEEPSDHLRYANNQAMPADQNRNDRSRHANYIRMKKINTQ